MTIPIPADLREMLRVADEAHTSYVAAAHALQGCTWVWLSSTTNQQAIPPDAVCHACGRTYGGWPS